MTTTEFTAADFGESEFSPADFGESPVRLSNETGPGKARLSALIQGFNPLNWPAVVDRGFGSVVQSAQGLSDVVTERKKPGLMDVVNSLGNPVTPTLALGNLGYQALRKAAGLDVVPSLGRSVDPNTGTVPTNLNVVQPMVEALGASPVGVPSGLAQGVDELVNQFVTPGNAALLPLFEAKAAQVPIEAIRRGLIASMGVHGLQQLPETLGQRKEAIGQEFEKAHQQRVAEQAKQFNQPGQLEEVQADKGQFDLSQVDWGQVAKQILGGAAETAIPLAMLKSGRVPTAEVPPASPKPTYPNLNVDRLPQGKSFVDQPSGPTAEQVLREQTGIAPANRQIEGPKGQFVSLPDGRVIDWNQLTPVEQAEFMRGRTKGYVPREEQVKPMQNPPVVLGQEGGQVQPKLVLPDQPKPDAQIVSPGDVVGERKQSPEYLQGFPQKPETGQLKTQVEVSGGGLVSAKRPGINPVEDAFNRAEQERKQNENRQSQGTGQELLRKQEEQKREASLQQGGSGKTHGESVRDAGTGGGEQVAKELGLRYDGVQEMIPGQPKEVYTSQDAGNPYTLYMDVGATKGEVEARLKEKEGQNGGKLYANPVFDPEFWKGQIKLAKDAVVSGSQLYNKLRNALGENSRAWALVNTDEFKYRLLHGSEKVKVGDVIEMAQQADRKSVERGFEEAGKQTEVHSYGMEGKVSEAKKEYDRMTHEWYDADPLNAYIADRLYDNQTVEYIRRRAKENVPHVNEALLTDENIAKGKRHAQLLKQIENEPSDVNPKATSHYEYVSALPTTEPMPEWTKTKSGKNVQRVDVVIPQQLQKTVAEQAKENAEYARTLAAVNDPEIRNAIGSVRPQPVHEPMWRQDNLHENLPNTLGWAMVQYKTGPKGEKIAVIAEAQSRWQQQKREYEKVHAVEKKKILDDRIKRGFSNDANALMMADKEAHREAARHVDQYRPGMDTKENVEKDYNRLILKAAIEQARKEGATHIVVSDAETAMMTEGHDAHKPEPMQELTFGGHKVDHRLGSSAYKEVTVPELVGWEIPGTGGVRANGKVRLFAGNEPGRDVLVAGKTLGGYEDFWTKSGDKRVASRDKWDAKFNELGYKNVDKDWSKWRPEQEPGMRLNYDTILPKIAEELTGSKGERVSLGEHKNAFETKARSAARETGDNVGATAQMMAMTGEQNVNVPRSNLIFRNADGTPKTDVSGQMYPLDKLEIKPSSPSAKLYGGLPILDPDLWKGSVKAAKDTVNKALDSISSYGSDTKLNEKISAFANKQAGYSVPRHVASDENVANKMVRYASANIASGERARAMATEVLGDKYKDSNFDQRLGRVLVEDRLRALESTHRDKGQDALADKVTHIMSEVEFQKELSNPDIKAAIARHKAPGGIQELAEKQHVALGGKLAKVGEESKAFVNLLAITKAENVDAAKSWIYGRGNVLPQGVQKGSVFNRKALGVAPEYETSYRKVAERMVEGNFKRNALRDWLDAGVEKGIYKYAKSGEQPPTMNGQPMVSVPVKVKATPWGSQVMKDLWVRRDLAPEVEQALAGSGAPAKAGVQMLLDLATELQVIGPTDFVFHTGNMIASIAGSLGGKNLLSDLGRKVPVVKQLDAIGRVGIELYRVIVDAPEIQKTLAEISEIGAMRARSERQSLLAKVGGKAVDTGHWIRLIDQAGRVARNKMFDNLVERGLAKDSELNRREFINKMGQYNEKLMSRFQAFQRQYFSQFVVAGRTFNRNAFQRLLMSNEVQAANPAAYWKMKMLNTVGLFVSALAIPVVINSMITGQPFGRPGTKVGQIDTGKDDKEGRHIEIDPLQSDLTRRGLRISGVQALTSGIEDKKSASDIAKNMAADIVKGQLHPWAGPPVRVGYAGISEYSKSHDTGHAIKEALKAVNPTFEAYFKKDEEGQRGGFSAVAESLGSAVGRTKSRIPTHQEKIEELTKQDTSKKSDLLKRVAAERKYSDYKPKASKEDQARGATIAIQRNLERGELVQSQLAPEAQQWLEEKKLSIPGHDDRLRYGGADVVMTPDELKEFQDMLVKYYTARIDYLKTNTAFAKASAKQQEQVFNAQMQGATSNARTTMLRKMKKQ